MKDTNHIYFKVDPNDDKFYGGYYDFDGATYQVGYLQNTGFFGILEAHIFQADGSLMQYAGFTADLANAESWFRGLASDKLDYAKKVS